jgi:hypothetical protein
MNNIFIEEYNKYHDTNFPTIDTKTRGSYVVT